MARGPRPQPMPPRQKLEVAAIRENPEKQKLEILAANPNTYGCTDQGSGILHAVDL